MPRLPGLALPDEIPGQPLLRFDGWATAGFTIAALAAVAAPGPLRIPFAVLSCVLFAVGIVAFLAAFGHAVNRSRTDAINLAGIYGLSKSSPPSVQRRFHLLTTIQTIVSIATAAMRPFTAQAFGILVPMLGIGLGGLWAARHGVFGEREDPRNAARNQVKESFND